MNHKHSINTTHWTAMLGVKTVKKVMWDLYGIIYLNGSCVSAPSVM